MTLVEKVQAAAAEILLKRANDVVLQELLEFYRKKQEEGAVVKQVYDLPPIDTVGRTVYRSK
jgi:hypothetical protein